MDAKRCKIDPGKFKTHDDAEDCVVGAGQGDNKKPTFNVRAPFLWNSMPRGRFWALLDGDSEAAGETEEGAVYTARQTQAVVEDGNHWYDWGAVGGSPRSGQGANRSGGPMEETQRIPKAAQLLSALEQRSLSAKSRLEELRKEGSPVWSKVGVVDLHEPADRSLGKEPHQYTPRILRYATRPTGCLGPRPAPRTELSDAPWGAPAYHMENCGLTGVHHCCGTVGVAVDANTQSAGSLLPRYVQRIANAFMTRLGRKRQATPPPCARPSHVPVTKENAAKLAREGVLWLMQCGDERMLPALEWVDEKTGQTVVHMLLDLGQNDVVTELVRRYPNKMHEVVIKVDKNGRTAVDAARMGGNRKMIAMITALSTSTVFCNGNKGG